MLSWQPSTAAAARLRRRHAHPAQERRVTNPIDTISSTLSLSGIVLSTFCTSNVAAALAAHAGGYAADVDVGVEYYEDLDDEEDDSFMDYETGEDDVPYGAADVALRMGRGYRTDEAAGPVNEARWAQLAGILKG